MGSTCTPKAMEITSPLILTKIPYRDLEGAGAEDKCVGDIEAITAKTSTNPNNSTIRHIRHLNCFNRVKSKHPTIMAARLWRFNHQGASNNTLRTLD
jgi:hypothetical protein